ncbi:2-polyprenylphenol hydroxylase [Bifidobacterium actinocoloniiforme]|uniref:iron-sulfur cluster-binding protein n=1 Tax=Bifidobacterium actinocoloniiforme TaxID=638619 RepID=UPI000529B222|nr:2-polyprenylphenol hydroxylase [Bifidobacterium actinocoloniiforme DSM 22766]
MQTTQFRPTEQVVAQAQAEGKRPGRRTAKVSAALSLEGGAARLLTVRDPYAARTASAGQFVNLYAPDPSAMLPRPFGVARTDGDELDLVYQVIGRGTAALARLKPGDEVDLLGPLGRPYDLSRPGDYLLVGGGLGVPPLIAAAQALSQRADARAIAVFGYQNERFADPLVAASADRTLSISEPEGDVITLLDRFEPQLDPARSAIISCGPTAMMKAVAAWAAARSIPAQFSLEERMGCGYGACVACAVDTVDGRLKVCADGPVFTGEQLGWTNA